MKILLLLVSLFLADKSATTNRYYTKNAVITFFSKAPLENITAINKNAVGTWNLESGEIEFSVLIKGFVFKKGLMQQHFNENYMESNKYPKATFKGTTKPKFESGSESKRQLTAEGMLTIHGVTRNVTTVVEATAQKGKIAATTKFNVLLSDYNISIPSLVKNNLNNNVEVTVVVNEFIPFN